MGELKGSVPADKKSEEKDDEFVKISKESEEIIQKMEKSFEESQKTKSETVQESKNENKTEIIKIESSSKSDSFKEIEKESKEIVSKLEQSFVSTEEQKDINYEKEDNIIKAGILNILLSKAEDLENKDLIGKSDPFVKIKYRDQELKSKKVRNSLAPEWNFSADFIVSPIDEDSDVVFEVYDDDFGKENFIGSFKMPVTQAITKSGLEPVWYPLTACKSGKINFSTLFTPDEEENKESNMQNEQNHDKTDSINDSSKPDESSGEKDSSNEKDERNEQATESSDEGCKDSNAKESKREIDNKVTELQNKTEVCDKRDYENVDVAASNNDLESKKEKEKEDLSLLNKEEPIDSMKTKDQVVESTSSKLEDENKQIPSDVVNEKEESLKKEETSLTQINISDDIKDKNNSTLHHKLEVGDPVDMQKKTLDHVSKSDKSIEKAEDKKEESTKDMDQSNLEAKLNEEKSSKDMKDLTKIA